MRFLKTQKLTFYVSEEQFVAGSWRGQNRSSRLMFGCTRVLVFFLLLMRAPPAVALSPFDAQLRDSKM